MMKYRYNILLRLMVGALGTLLMTSCAREDFDWLIGTPINVTATAESVTRSVANIQTTNFEAGQTINAYYKITGGDVIGNSPTTLTAGAPVSGKNTLTPDVQPYYPSTGTVDIYALYPPTKATATTTSFSVEANQIAPEDYKLSDLMWASVYNQAKTTNDVNLTFSHKMAKIAISVTGQEGVTIKNIKLINTIREIAVDNIALSTRALGTLASPSTAAEKQIVVATSSTTAGDEVLSGAALFPGQTIEADFIEVETNYGTTIFSAGNKTFVGGTEYTANLVITRQMIGFTATITDWTADNGTIAVPPGSSAGLYISNIPVMTYTGSAIEPELQIVYSMNSVDYNLVEGVDYELQFFNNVNQGTATIIINGKADPNKIGSGSEGTQEAASAIAKIRAIKNFNIVAATGNISYPNNNANKTVEYQYNATIDNPLDKGNGDGTFTYESINPSVARVSESGIVSIVSVGFTTIKAHMADDGNYTAADAQYELEVTPRKLNTAKIAGEIVISLAYSSVTYTGEAFTPSVVVTDKGRTLQENTHYTVSYSNNTSKGTATVTIRGKGNYSNLPADDATTTFSIVQATPTISIPSTDEITLPVGFNYTRRATSDLGTVTYSSDNTSVATVSDNGVVTAKGEGSTTIRVTVTADANANYQTATTSYPITVVKSYWSYSYTGAVQKWTCPLTGVYQLEALGAQGATYGGFVGGRGAQIAGQLKVQKNQVIYIYVGQQGVMVQTGSATQGGWNGGGKYTGSNSSGSSETIYCGGGGATDFALQGTEGSTTWNSSDHLNSRILVAAGGGGALFREYPSNNIFKFTGGGGGGGAYIGETGYGGSKPGGGGTLSSAGTIATGGSQAVAAGFGYGGNYSGTLSAGMGGGGWYGGASGAFDAANENPSGKNFSRGGSGGGGSSYIWNNDNATYYNGHGTNNAPKTTGSIVTDPVKFYITPTILTEGARPGNGEARITYMGADE